MRVSHFLSVTGTMIAANTFTAGAQTAQKPNDLASMGLEELMKVQVTTESKEAQSLDKVPAAIYVVTQEQIRRSGATNIPDALRMVPGVQVQQIDPSKWSIGIRGMGGRFSDKLLVMLDGRTVYTPSFSGVLWDAQDIDMALVERIEVIRGPGGTLWGANAVNGIINIITKTAKTTLGNRLTVGTAGTSPYEIDASHGGTMKSGAYRIFGRAHRDSNLPTQENQPGANDWQALRGGFRSDWSAKGNSFTLSSEANTAHQGQNVLLPTLTAPYAQFGQTRYVTSEFYMLGRWERTEGKNSGTSLQMSFDHSDRDDIEIHERRTTFAADFQNPISLTNQNKLIWGLGYNSSGDDNLSKPTTVVTPSRRTSSVYSGFVHDEERLSSNITLSLGTKIEHNAYTGWENQPSARILYTPSHTQTFWGAVSRAVRTPARGDSDATLVLSATPGPGGATLQLNYVGNPAIQSQVVVSHELGWRYEPSNHWFVDVTAFYNRYSGLRGGTMGTPGFDLNPFPHGVIPVLDGNDYSATTGGVEFATRVAVTPNWSLDGSYSFYTESFQLSNPAGGVLGPTGAGAGNAPRHQFSIRSQVNLPKRLEFDTTAYYVGGIGSPQFGSIPAYARIDLRLGWHPTDRVDWSVGVTNLTSANHREEHGVLYDDSSVIRRNVYARVTIRF